MKRTITVRDKQGKPLEMVHATGKNKLEVSSAVITATKGTIDASKITVVVNTTGRKPLGAQ